MAVFEPHPDRWKLGFKKAVLDNFKFLREYGYHRARAEVTFVRYEMPWYSFRRRFYVNVYHGRGAYDLGVEIGPRDDEREEVTLLGILNWAKAPEVKNWRIGDTLWVAGSREAVQTLVPKVAELVRTYAGPFLRGDAEAFRTLKKIVSEVYAVWEEKIQRYSPRRHQAILAWKAKDFERVAAIYESFENDLLPEEKDRLAEARKVLATRPNTGPQRGEPT